MSGDEFLVLIASLVVSLPFWFLWYARLLRVQRFYVQRIGADLPSRRLLGAVPFLCAAILFAILKVASAHDVRDDPFYLFFYLMFGSAWLCMGASLLSLLGISARDDVLERRNRAAAYAISGAMLAVTICFAGGNIGNGPGWWVVVLSAGLATGALACHWLLLETCARVADSITIDRDQATGLRLAGFLVALAAILARAVAGDWVSVEATVRDFAVRGWPTLPLLALAVLAERYAQATPARPQPSALAAGILPGLFYIVAALICLLLLGWPV
ncbi:MAG: hypothetical protein L0Y71_19330 [Gemmataceae bacterium]|nr:hypothetical protein [Gemmataceae bacterium]